MAKTALIPIADGTEELEAVAIIDTLRRGGVQVTVASVMPELQVTASRQVKLVADTLIGECVNATYDLIALPGGLPGAEHLRDSAPLVGMLTRQKAEGRLYGAICASPAVALSPHGLLHGLKATCYPGFEEKFTDAEAVDARVVVDGTCITSQGPGTAIEFALKLLEVLFDADKAAQVGAPMLAMEERRH